eukprot:5854731-Pyramimonas_sp.AAC.1
MYRLLRGCQLGKCPPPLEDNLLTLRRSARTPLLGLQRRESFLLLRRDDPESCQNAIPGT